MKTHLLIASALIVLATCANATVTVNSIDTPVPDALSVRVGGTITAANEAASFVFEYGITTAYGEVSQATAVDKNTSAHVQFTVASGLKANTHYHMRIKASGSVTKTPVYSGDVTFTTTSPVAVIQTSAPTVSQTLVEAGPYSGINFNISPDAGSFPFTYQWKKNGVNFGTATPYGYLNINSVTTSHGGTWTCIVSNPMPSSATSPGVLVTVATITKFPSSANAAIEGGTISASVTLTPANAAATYHWYTSSNASLTGIGTVSGQGTSKLTIAGVNANTEDEYQCDVTIGAKTLTLSTGLARIGLKPVISPISAQSFLVGEDTGGINVNVNSNIAVTTTVAGLPAGLKYSTSDQSITGAPAAATPIDEPAAVVITAKNANGTSTFAFPFTVNPLPSGLVGAWSGTLDRNGDAKQLGGKVTLNVTATGSVTGSVTLGTITYPVNTALATTTGSTSAALNATLRSGSNPTLSLALTLDTDVLSGDAGGAGASGRRNPWNPANPVPITGSFNCEFTPGTSQLSDVTYPHGYSTGSLALTGLGAVSASLRMADGTAVTASSTMGGNGDVPLFATLYSGNGSVLGTPNINGRDVTGTLSWNKQSTTAQVAYKAGFASHDLTCTGKRYVQPNPGLSQYYIGLAAGTNNAKLSVSDGGISAPFSQLFNVALNGAATISTDKALNPSAVTVTLDTATGAINGTFVLTLYVDPLNSKNNVYSTATYYGLAVPGLNEALGAFTYTVRNPATAANPILSGIVDVTGP